MPYSNLFAVNNQGRVFALQTDHMNWEELPYLGIDFKRISAHDKVVWGLGGDHQVYVFVYGTSVPIRVCEESYENQRWNPLEGFTSNLLPSDRPAFSSIDGLEERQLTDIHLPSLAWNWEGPWHLQDTFEGKALNKECWTYAVDFPRYYVADKSWKSCVRRRKWVRYRRYIALDTWSAVSSIHKDHTQEPFIDISLGGGDVIGEESDKLLLWAITAFGKVAVREGICSTCPEGAKWTFVSTPSDQDVVCISAGRSGRVWALTWDGSALVRNGISRNHPLGLGWNMVKSPGNPLSQIAVGNNAVWGVCRDYSLWFRRGLDDSSKNEFSNQGNQSHIHDNSDPGSSWLQMIGSLSMASVGPNDQVWGIAYEDHSVMIRMGVTSSELTGKTWRKINLPLHRFDPNNHDPTVNLFDNDSISEDNLIESIPAAYGGSESQDTSSMKSNICGTESSRQSSVSPSTFLREIGDASELCSIEIDAERSEFYIEDSNKAKICTLEESSRVTDMNIDQISLDRKFSGSDFNNLHTKNPDGVSESQESTGLSDRKIDSTSLDKSGKEDLFSNSPKGSKNSIEESESTVNELEDDANESNLQLKRVSSLSDETFLSSTSSINSEVFIPRGGNNSIIHDDTLIYSLNLQEENLWVWVSGSGCWVQSTNMPRWFTNDYESSNWQEPWRQSIAEKLLSRKTKENEGFQRYEESIECSSWVVNGHCRILVLGQWVPASIELQTSTSKFSLVQEACLKILYTQMFKKTIVIPCCSIVLCSLLVDLPAKALLSVFTPKSPLQPIPLLFSAEKDAEQWLNHISTACIQFRGVDMQPSSDSIWGVSSLGFIYFHDFTYTEKEVREITKAANCLIDVGTGSTPFIYKLERKFRPGCFFEIKGKIHDGARRFHIDLLLDKTSANIALHMNPRFEEKVVVMNTREHNQWSYEEREGLQSIQRGKECHITILCDDRDMKITVNEKFYYCFTHRVMPSDITHISIEGDIHLSELVYNYGAGKPTLCEYFWRGVGGHLRVVETGAGGITWGLSYDSHVYTYTGACGGGIYKGNANDPNIYIMSDIRHFYVWENQRWNPLTGFTHRGLPTDRKTWSDQSGKHEITKEGTKLPSRHWQWIGDWTIDHHTPNGVDKDGWQYATDFPMSYHAHRYVTDLVRRRRWVRKCRISTSGPWKQMEKVSLISLSISPQYAENGTVPVWGVSASNEVVMREGVTPKKIRGSRWCLIPSEMPMKEISATIEGGIWAVSVTGQAHLRIGVTKSNPKGYDWVNIDAPNAPLKQVCMGSYKVWGLDQYGSLYYRLNVLPLFPEGTAWQQVCSGVNSVSVATDGSLWAILAKFSQGEGESSGVIARRKGVSKDAPGGTGWDICVGSGWNSISARFPVPSHML